MMIVGWQLSLPFKIDEIIFLIALKKAHFPLLVNLQVLQVRCSKASVGNNFFLEGRGGCSR
jgi:hypothetical protein